MDCFLLVTIESKWFERIKNSVFAENASSIILPRAKFATCTLYKYNLQRDDINREKEQ